MRFIRVAIRDDLDIGRAEKTFIDTDTGVTRLLALNGYDMETIEPYFSIPLFDSACEKAFDLPSTRMTITKNGNLVCKQFKPSESKEAHEWEEAMKNTVTEVSPEVKRLTDAFIDTFRDSMSESQTEEED